MLVPSRGASGFLTATNAQGTRFGVVGGFAAGDIIRRVTLSFAGSGGATLVFAASMGSSREASLVALGAGVPIFSSSQTFLGSTPSIAFDTVSGGFHQFVVPLGRRVGSGGAFFVFAFVAGTVAASAVFVGVESVRVLGGPEREKPSTTDRLAV